MDAKLILSSQEQISNAPNQVVGWSRCALPGAVLGNVPQGPNSLYLGDGLANKDDKLANGSRRLGTSGFHFRIRAGSCLWGFGFANFGDSSVLLVWRNLSMASEH